MLLNLTFSKNLGLCLKSFHQKFNIARSFLKGERSGGEGWGQLLQPTIPWKCQVHWSLPFICLPFYYVAQVTQTCPPPSLKPLQSQRCNRKFLDICTLLRLESFWVSKKKIFLRSDGWRSPTWWEWHKAPSLFGPEKFILVCSRLMKLCHAGAKSHCKHWDLGSLPQKSCRPESCGIHHLGKKEC